MKKYLILSIIFLFVGIFFFAIQKELIIIRIPKIKKEASKKQDTIVKKNINLFFWQHNNWKKENIEIIWSNSIAENSAIIISSWLNLLDEEKIIDKKVSLQNALLSENCQVLYISFDRQLFNEESSTFEKLILVESLLKTLRENDLDVKKVSFLIHHQEMKDHHLDFSHAWPITGFLQS